MMKKFLLLLLPFILTVTMIACDSSSEGASSKNDDNASHNTTSSESINGEESVDRSDISDIESDSNAESSADPTDEEIERTIDIAVEISGKDTLDRIGYEVDSEFNKTVSVTVNGKKSVVNALTADDISASIDVSGVAESGDIEFLITYVAPDDVTIVKTSDSFATIEIKKVSSEIIPPAADDVRIVNGVLISGTRAMEQFGGGESGGQKTAAMLNDFKQTIGSDVNVYVLPAPLASAFYAPEGYEKSITRHQDCFYGMRDALENVGFVDTLKALSAHVDEDIYFRTDHHWQALAAYYCCEELAKVAGVPFDDISKFKVYSSEGMLGSFYSSYTHDAVLGNNPDTMVWYEPTRAHTVEYYSRDYYTNPVSGRTLFSSNDGYTKFIYGDSYTTHITSNVGNGRKILIFKDSYGNALAPFLVGSFDEVYVADYRYFKLDVSDFIEQEGITDVCFSLAAFKVNNCNAVDIKY